MKILNTLAVTAALPVLAGCGAGGAGLTFAPAGSGPITTSEIQAIEAQLNALADSLSASDVTLATPSTATATYNGFVGMGLDATTSVTGRISLSADFVGGSVTGSASDFSVFDDTAAIAVPLENLSGTLPVTGGVISGTSMTADMNGTITAAAGTYGVSSTINGVFADISGQGVVGGDVNGGLTNPDTSITTIDGAFIAVQQ